MILKAKNASWPRLPLPLPIHLVRANECPTWRGKYAQGDRIAFIFVIRCQAFCGELLFLFPLEIARHEVLSLVFCVVFYCEDKKELRMQPGCNARAHADRRHNQDYANICIVLCV